MRSVALNFRSCGGEPNRLPRFYHAGDTGDLAHVLDYLAERWPDAPLAAVGFSLGANVLLKYLGERGEESRIRAAAAVSIPFDLAAGAKLLEESWAGRMYIRIFLKSLKAKYRQKQALIGDACDTERVLSSRTFFDFDDAATARLHGFSGVDEYYGTSSSRNFIASIRVPTLLLHAEDDPFVPPSAIPRAAIAANPWLTAAITKDGGHVGFIGGTPLRPTFWAETEAARFLAQQL